MTNLDKQPPSTLPSDIDDLFRRLEERIEYNRHDMGEMGMFIRVGYVKNFLKCCSRTTIGALRRFD